VVDEIEVYELELWPPELAGDGVQDVVVISQQKHDSVFTLMDRDSTEELVHITVTTEGYSVSRPDGSEPMDCDDPETALSEAIVQAARHQSEIIADRDAKALAEKRVNQNIDAIWDAAKRVAAPHSSPQRRAQ